MKDNIGQYRSHGFFSFATRAEGDKETPGCDGSKNLSSGAFSEMYVITWLLTTDTQRYVTSQIREERRVEWF